MGLERELPLRAKSAAHLVLVSRTRSLTLACFTLLCFALLSIFGVSRRSLKKSFLFPTLVILGKECRRKPRAYWFEAAIEDPVCNERYEGLTDGG